MIWYASEMKSVRISDDLFALARSESSAMSRSIAQQLEHWAKIGAALEQAGVTQEQLRKILGGDLRVRERVFMKLGLLQQANAYLIPRAEARSFMLKAPSPESLDMR
jgi:ParD-like antitoxin of type II bacterial toxin-antitoxin system